MNKTWIALMVSGLMCMSGTGCQAAPIITACSGDLFRECDASHVHVADCRVASAPRSEPRRADHGALNWTAVPAEPSALS